MNIKDVKEGDRLIADDGFTCLNKGQVVEVFRDTDGFLVVHCSGGHHFLDDQTDADGTLIGLRKAE